MEKVTIAVLKTVIALSLAGSLFVQFVLLALVWHDMTEAGEPFWGSRSLHDHRGTWHLPDASLWGLCLEAFDSGAQRLGLFGEILPLHQHYDRCLRFRIASVICPCGAVGPG